MTKLVVENLRKSFGEGERKVLALDGISFEVLDEDLFCLIGPSGCGKTTTIRIIAGFIKPSSGKVEINGQTVSKPGGDRGVVFQHHALFPWRSVRGNVEFGPAMNGVPKRKRKNCANKYLELVGLLDFADAATYELSGGMKQRVGLARALANEPEILLMDEPFGSLDALTREEMEVELLKIWKETKKTILFITHDVEEATFLATQLAILTSRPSKVKKILKLPFSENFSQKNTLEDARSLKATSDFVKQRQEALSLIWE